MKTNKVVFNKPFGKTGIEDFRISTPIARGNELFLDSAVEAFVVEIVGGSAHSGVVLLYLEFLASGSEMFF